MNAIILKSTGSWYLALTEDGRKISCRMRGRIRLEESKETNPVTVGDKVIIENDQDDFVIGEILPRKNHILRQSVKKTGHSHVLAANIDQAMLITTLKQPRTSMGFIDRFLVTAEAYQIPQLILYNKADLLDEDEKTEVKSILSIYESIGIKTFFISAAQDERFEELLKSLNGKITLVAGHSGVGKSTLFNRLSPDFNQATDSISGYSDKGKHTTTFAEMFQVNKDTFLIDTPGVKEWGLVDMHPQEISDYFPEMRDLRSNCKFGSKCIHHHEPKCAVREAVESGKISHSRFESYLSMIEGKDNRK